MDTLLFLSISIAIRFSSRFFVSINNLISASNNIGNGNLNSKVPEIKTDKELEKLNKNFNLMIDRLKTQQNKLLANERHDAWENVARKIAHESTPWNGSSTIHYQDRREGWELASIGGNLLLSKGGRAARRYWGDYINRRRIMQYERGTAGKNDPASC